MQNSKLWLCLVFLTFFSFGASAEVIKMKTKSSAKITSGLKDCLSDAGSKARQKAVSKVIKKLSKGVSDEVIQKVSDKIDSIGIDRYAFYTLPIPRALTYLGGQTLQYFLDLKYFNLANIKSQNSGSAKKNR